MIEIKATEGKVLKSVIDDNIIYGYKVTTSENLIDNWTEVSEQEYIDYKKELEKNISEVNYIEGGVNNG